MCPIPQNGSATTSFATLGFPRLCYQNLTASHEDVPDIIVKSLVTLVPVKNALLSTAACQRMQGAAAPMYKIRTGYIQVGLSLQQGNKNASPTLTKV